MSLQKSSTKSKKKSNKSSKKSRSTKKTTSTTPTTVKDEKRSSTEKTATSNKMQNNSNGGGELESLKEENMTIEEMMTASLGDPESTELSLTRTQKCKRGWVRVPWATVIGVLLLIMASIAGHVFIIKAHRYTVISFGRSVNEMMSPESKEDLDHFSLLLSRINKVVQATFCLAYIISPGTLTIAILSSGDTRLVFGKHIKSAKAAISLLICMQIILFLLYMTFVIAEASMGVNIGKHITSLIYWLFYALEASCEYTRNSLHDLNYNPKVRDLMEKYQKLQRTLFALTGKKSSLPELKSECIAGVLCIDIRDLYYVCNNFTEAARLSVNLAICVIVCMLGLAIILVASGSNFVWLFEIEKEFYYRQARKKFEADLEKSGELHSAGK